ncbi:hypothetical protein BKA70DRAFT_1261444 [Coprinopsis sp. MPI-PUGE-AT-0042]|nr:hypothetical protein BKA70DRAFT_1261444 [Coprinopsis sp. MPI-PUGE-AT-0042]
MLLAKIPLLLASMIAIHVATTPPQAPASRSERVPSLSTIRETYLLTNFGLVKVVKALWWSASLAEVISILILTSDSRHLLRYLQFGGGDLEALDLSSAFLFGTVVTVAGGLGRVLCYRTLGKFFTFEMSIKKDHDLIRSGPYSVVRHPSYSAAILNCFGMFFVFAWPGSWTRESGVLDTGLGMILVLGPFVFYPLIIISLIRRLPDEEEALHQMFGKEWEQWKKEVPYKLLPFVY